MNKLLIFLVLSGIFLIACSSQIPSPYEDLTNLERFQLERFQQQRKKEQEWQRILEETQRKRSSIETLWNVADANRQLKRIEETQRKHSSIETLWGVADANRRLKRIEAINKSRAEIESIDWKGFREAIREKNKQGYFTENATEARVFILSDVNDLPTAITRSNTMCTQPLYAEPDVFFPVTDPENPNEWIFSFSDWFIRYSHPACTSKLNDHYCKCVYIIDGKAFYLRPENPEK